MVRKITDWHKEVNMHVPFLLSWVVLCGLLLGIVLSVRTCWFHNVVSLTTWHVVSADFGTWSYQCLFSNFSPISLHMLKCSWAHTLSWLFICCSFVNIGLADTMCSTVSSNCLQSLNVPSVSICNISVAWYLACNAWSSAAIISLSISSVISPLYSQ